MPGEAQPFGQPRSLSYNLLPALRELLRLRSVTKAAAKLNMSQSAMSDSLARLRAYFNDELLILSGREFVLSDKAREIEPIVLDMLEKIEILFRARPFAVADFVGRVKIVAPEAVVLAMHGSLCGRIRRSAPRMSVHFARCSGRDIDDLVNSLIDFALVYAFEPPVDDVKLGCERIFDESLVLVGGATTAVTDANGAVAAFRAAHLTEPKRVLVEERSFSSMRDGALQVIFLPSLRLLPCIMGNDGGIALMPRRLADRLDSATCVQLGTHLPPVGVYLLWNRACATDPLHLWLMEQIRASAPDA